MNDGTTTELTVDAAQQRFRARAFYQKQLSTLVSSSDQASEQITGIAAAEFIEHRRLIERDISAAKRQTRSAFQTIIEYWVAESEYTQSLADVADLRRRLEAVKSKMEISGLSKEHQDILNAAPRFNLVSNLITETNEATDIDISTLENLSDMNLYHFGGLIISAIQEVQHGTNQKEKLRKIYAGI